MSICAHECADNEEKILLFHLSFPFSHLFEAEIIEWTNFLQNSKEQRFFLLRMMESLKFPSQKRRPKFFFSKKSQNEMNEKISTTTKKKYFL
jgi:hypothetical protein